MQPNPAGVFLASPPARHEYFLYVRTRFFYLFNRLVFSTQSIADS